MQKRGVDTVKALIIGAAGFVGDYLMDYLKPEGFDTYVTKKLNTERKIGELGITEFDLNILNLLQSVIY